MDHPQLKRQIGLYAATAVTVGSIIGSGIFRSPSSVARELPSQPLMLAAWILGATTSIGVGLLALTLVGEDLRGDASRPLTADATVVADQTSTPAPTTQVASPSAAPVTSTAEPGTDEAAPPPKGPRVSGSTPPGSERASL